MSNFESPNKIESQENWELNREEAEQLKKLKWNPEFSKLVEKWLQKETGSLENLALDPKDHFSKENLVKPKLSAEDMEKGRISKL